MLLFEVFDEDTVSHELIGKAEVTMGDIMLAKKRTFCCALVHDKLFQGTLKIKADLVNISEDTIKLAFAGNVVSNKFICFGFDNPYMIIERARLYTEQEMAAIK